jgi:transposase
MGSQTFEVLLRRWAGERTLAWITSYRRCARDYEHLDDALVNIVPSDHLRRSSYQASLAVTDSEHRRV